MPRAGSGRRIDAHHHLWRIDRGDYDWIEPGSPLSRDYTLDDLRPLLEAGVRTVLVQATETEAETAFLLESARRSDGLVQGVVGWSALDAPDAEARIGRAAEDRLLVGLRPMLQDLADPDWILRPCVLPALRAMAGAGLRLDLLIRDRQLPLVPRLAERVPELVLVLDHAAKPPLRSGDLSAWRRDIAAAARVPQLSCKLSGLANEADPGWSDADLLPVVEHLLACFGPERLMWGSDWPVVELAGGYAAWRGATDRLLGSLPAGEREMIEGGTARRVYRLPPDHEEPGPVTRGT